MIYIQNLDYIKDIISSLKIQFKEKHENINVDKLFTNELNSKSKICIVEQDFFNQSINENNDPFSDFLECVSESTPPKKESSTKSSSNINLEQYKYILLIENHVEPNIFDLFLKYEIIGIFRKSRLKYDLEEKGKLEKMLKEELRKLNNGIEENPRNFEILKKIPYKNITSWKFNPKVKSKEELEDLYKEKKYISIFLDPSMKKFYHQLHIITKDFANSFKRYFNNLKISEFRAFDLKKTQELIQKELKENYKLPSILIEGETGTGKSLIANIIYKTVKELTKNDNLTLYRFSLVNINENLIDSEIFGSRIGAFSGANDRKGRLMENIFGIVFFDEIAELPTSIQAKLLLYLDDYKITPEGYDGEPLTVPTFVISATNKNIKQEIMKGTFRSDLYYRFKYKLYVPSLIERKEDLRFLISFILQSPFINEVSDNLNYSVDKISFEAIEKLEGYTYPGNFRELEEILKNAVNECILNNQTIILPENIKFENL
ncbi:MAG: sigma 54-interacting transcriptional regulator [Candidatus Cloacimonadales bacterium]|jgi:transcriptional regulator with PAS, ATPase and Fis domain|nr:sigma 54-interacting transcriptional regulator [Patescibacteria group bacterium]HOB16488.1 sigma 54-interacting transcriptional regulator [Defluviitoga sp.]HPZ29157.1 sigma 54-interacting transcriptional regulator [Defluviitoga sp.]HQD63116.1 sigma 54-interacting transcriptional regulator [Defluviitoga sp.]